MSHRVPLNSARFFLLFLLAFAFLAVSGCSPGERGPFDHPDGVYEGASDLYD